MSECASILGLGRMGSAAARRLASRGYSLVLWSRSIEKAQKMAESIGGRIASTPREAGEECSSIHVFVSDDEASLEVLLGNNGVFTGSSRDITVYNHSTVTPRHTSLVYNTALAKGLHYVEAPVIGGPGDILNGNAIILCGAREAGECATRSLNDLGEVVYVGQPPQATAAKLAFNIVFLALMGGLAEAFMLAEAYGVGYKSLVERVLSKTWLGAVVQRYGRRLEPGSEPGFLARLAGKDARYAMEALQDKGLPGFVASAIAAYYSLADNLGGGDLDYPAMPVYLALQLTKRVK